MKLLPITITGKTLSTTASPAVKGDKDIDALSIAVPVSYEGTNLTQDAWHIRFKLPGGTVHTDPLTDGVPDDAEAPTILTFTYPMQGLIVSQSGNVALQIINVPADGSSIFQTLPGPSITVSGTLEGPPSADYNAAPWGTYLAQYEAIRDETKQYRDEAVDGAASALESASNAQESATQAAGSATDSHNSELAAKGYEEGAGLIKGAIDSLVASAPFQAVVGVADDIPTVAEVAEDIPAVAGAAPSIPTLAGVAEEVALLGPVATQIGQLSLIKDQIVSLEAEKLKVVAVEAKLTEIQGVYAKLAEIEGVYGKSTEIDALYAQLDTIAAKANQADLDAVEARVDASELTLARQGQDLASVKQTLQQGNGATLDFSGIGSVALDARATGRANPTVEGLTATNLVPVDYVRSNPILETYITVITVNCAIGDKFVIKNSLLGAQYTLQVCDNPVTKAYAQHTQADGEKLSIVTTDKTQILLRIKEFPSVPLNGKLLFINLTQTFGAGNEPTASDCAKIFSYFDGTKSIQLPARVRSVGRNLNVEEYEQGDLGSGGQEQVNTARVRTEFINVREDIAYIVKATNPSYGIGTVNFYDREKTFISRNISSGQQIAFTTPTSCAYIRFTVGILPTYTSVITIADAISAQIQLELGSIATTYEPYKSSTLYIADDSELRSFGATTDLVKVINGELVIEKNVNDDATAVISPPVITPLLTSGVLQAKPKGTVYWEPYYEDSHQTDASSQITLPYTGTIDKLTGYDENLEPYEVPSTGYTLVGTTLTITGAEENEVFYVEIQRAEPLAPEMSVNTLNNEQVIADTTNGKFYKLVPTITNGALVSQTPVEVV